MQIKALQVKKNYAKPWSTGADQGLTTKALEQMMQKKLNILEQKTSVKKQKMMKIPSPLAHLCNLPVPHHHGKGGVVHR